MTFHAKKIKTFKFTRMTKEILLITAIALLTFLIGYLIGRNSNNNDRYHLVEKFENELIVFDTQDGVIYIKLIKGDSKNVKTLKIELVKDGQNETNNRK